MRDNRALRRRQWLRAGSVLTFFLIINVIIRFALVPLNSAEYTDGIIQLIQFEQPSGIYPPLYTALVWPFRFIFGDELAGRLVSAFFSTGALIPLFILARRSFGLRAAFFMALLYTVAPVTLRWAPRVMTDATFSFFFFFACERIVAAQGSRTAETLNKRLLGACIFGVLAALTRYQGLMLAPAILYAGFIHGRRLGVLPSKGYAGLALFALAPLWSKFFGNVHGDQFAQRAGENVIMTIILNGEAFLIHFMYFLTYPVAFFAIYGLCRGHSRPRFVFLPITIYTMIVLLVAQSAFGSFQERYFLPLFGLLLVWAGLGLAVLDDVCRRRHPRFRFYAPTIGVVFSLFMAVLVLAGSRDAWGDVRRASEFAASLAEETGALIYTNEVYPVSGVPIGTIAATKVEFYARRPSFWLGEEYFFGNQILPPGTLLVMLDIHGGPEQVRMLEQRYRLSFVESFTASVTPVFPDLMSIPGTGQNPIAWHFRYTPQLFVTSIFRVEGPR